MALRTASLSEQGCNAGKAGDSEALKGAELKLPFATRHDEAEHGLRRFRVVVHDEDPEILALWAAALTADGYDVDVVPAEERLEARIAELERIKGETQSDDVRGTIEGAIEDCELHLGKLEPESVYLLPPTALRPGRSADGS